MDIFNANQNQKRRKNQKIGDKKMKFLSESEMKTEKLLETINDSPMMIEIRKVEAEETLQKRKTAADKIEVLKKEQSCNLLELQKALKNKEGEYQKAKDTLQAALNQFRAAHRALSGENNRISREIDQQETILLETYNPSIDDAVNFFQDALDALRKPGKIHRIGRPSKLNPINWKKSVRNENNLGAIKAALVYCRNAIGELEKLKLSPVLDCEKIEKLKNGIPSIGIYEEVTSEIAAPGSKGMSSKEAQTQIGLEFKKAEAELEEADGKLKKAMKK